MLPCQGPWKRSSSQLGSILSSFKLHFNIQIMDDLLKKSMGTEIADVESVSCVLLYVTWYTISNRIYIKLSIIDGYIQAVSEIIGSQTQNWVAMLQKLIWRQKISHRKANPACSTRTMHSILHNNEDEMSPQAVPIYLRPFCSNVLPTFSAQLDLATWKDQDYIEMT